MRCPKCGYISFDHLTTCLNCSKDISGLTSAEQGTTYNAAVPMFLRFSSQKQGMDESEDFETASGISDDHLDIVDPDLDILVEDDEEGIAFSPEETLSEEHVDSEEDFSITLSDDDDSDEREIEIDLSQFEDTSVQDAGKGEQEDEFSMDLPDELADISDLGPPSPPPPQDKIPSEEASIGTDDEMDMNSLDMDLKLDDFDDGFSLTSSEKENAEETFVELSLDDIDLSDSPESKESVVKPSPKPARAPKSSEMDMDADLDFDLDLGGLTLPPKK